MAAALKVLGIPFLLSQILGFLKQDPRSLYSCIRVSRKWYWEGICWLWSVAWKRAIIALYKIGYESGGERANEHSSRIRELGLHRPPLKCFDDGSLIELPHLKKLTIDGLDLGYLLSRLSIAADRLEYLHLSRTMPNDLDQVRIQCHNVRELRLSHFYIRTGGVLEQSFINLMKNNRSITTLVVRGQKPAPPMSPAVFEALTLNPTLKVLATHQRVTLNVIGDTTLYYFGRARSQSTPPFQNIEFLQLRITNPALLAIILFLTRVKTLGIQLDVWDSQLAKELATLKELRSLWVIVQDVSCINGDDLIAIAEGCRELIELQIEQHALQAGSLVVPAYHFLIGACVERITALLPNLRLLVLQGDFVHGIPHTAILHIGRNCRQLETFSLRVLTMPLSLIKRLCTLAACLADNGVGEGRCLFPRLRELDLLIPSVLFVGSDLPEERRLLESSLPRLKEQEFSKTVREMFVQDTKPLWTI